MLFREDPDPPVPAIEHGGGGKRIDDAAMKAPTELTRMFPGVLKDVEDRRPSLPRRVQDLQVITVAKDLPPATPHQLLEPQRHANGQAAHPFRQGSVILRLRDQVNVIVLKRKVRDPNP